MHTPQPLRPLLSFVRKSPLIPVFTLAVAAVIYGCFKSQPVEPTTALNPGSFESTGEDFLINALDEIHSIAEWAQAVPPRSPKLPPRERKVLLSKASGDSVYVYGQITADGFGAVVTERHAYPKGLLLITVRKSHGGNGGRIVTETKRFITFENFQNDIPSQSNLTEVYTIADTIVTRVLRNGLLETYTFRLPVVTRTVNAVTGAVTVTRRFGADGSIVSERRDGTGALIQTARSSGLVDGSLLTRTEYPDSTWRSVRTLGQADGSILREITSGRGL
ncbi:MAG: hypothetical protein KF749_10005 [Bacteroidetes bacterium]|nr:hypothetical protein [Bacteroidota bacterium]MCW5896701.1 hypothetical protein [Bacteroidota bacterium]